MIQPTSDNVLVEIIEQGEEQKTKSGILLPKSPDATKRDGMTVHLWKGIVKGVGSDVKGYEKGGTIYWSAYEAFQVRGTKLFVIPKKHIMAYEKV